MVTLDEDSIYITDDHGEEVVMWTEQEWVDEPNVVLSIANAIKIYYEEGADKLRSYIA